MTSVSLNLNSYVLLFRYDYLLSGLFSLSDGLILRSVGFVEIISGDCCGDSAGGEGPNNQNYSLTSCG